MAQEIEFTASDEHRFSAYAAQPQGQGNGTIIVLQEIFGRILVCHGFNM